MRDFLEPDRVVVGDDGDWAGDAVVELYAPLGAPLVRTDIASAEMVKLASNAFLATKISFINEIANVCEVTGADVIEVARGIGLDDRIGPKFLQAGIGFGGTCLAGDETVLVRHHGRTTLLRSRTCGAGWRARTGPPTTASSSPSRLEVLSWAPGQAEPLFLPVMCATRRDYEGELRRGADEDGPARALHAGPPVDRRRRRRRRGRDQARRGPHDRRLAAARAWRARATGAGRRVSSLLAAAEAAELAPDKLIVRPPRGDAASDAARRAREVSPRRHARDRRHQAHRDDAPRRGWPPPSCRCAARRSRTAKNGTEVPSELTLDERVLAGRRALPGRGPRRRRPRAPAAAGRFHPEREQHLVDEVVALTGCATASASATSTCRRPTTVTRRSRGCVGAWWTQVLGLGRTSYEQRLPDLIWDRPPSRQVGAALRPLGGRRLVVARQRRPERASSSAARSATSSPTASCGSSASSASSRRGAIGRVAKSTKDTHWVRVSGADQVERRDRARARARPRRACSRAIARQPKRIAPTGSRRFDDGPAWVRVTSAERRAVRRTGLLARGGRHAHVRDQRLVSSATTASRRTSAALKQLAGNSGYHFQLLNAVIEVNELQKRRVMAKLEKHLGTRWWARRSRCSGSRSSRTPTTCARRRRSCSARGCRPPGRKVRAYDPVAEHEARKLMPGVEFADDAAGRGRGRRRRGARHRVGRVQGARLSTRSRRP